MLGVVTTYESHFFRMAPHVPHFGLKFLVVAGAVALFLLLRGAGAGRRRGGQWPQAGANSRGAMPPQAPPGVCPRCRSPLAIAAAYCARCGLPVTRPTPMPVPAQGGGGDGRFAAYALIALLLLAALAIVIYW